MFALKIQEKPKIWLALIGGLVFGLMPLSHTHSFLAAFVLLAAFIINNLFYSRVPQIKSFLVIVGVGLVLALPQLYFLMGAKNALGQQSDFLSFRSGWMVEPTIGSIKFFDDKINVFSLATLKFLWVNFGLMFFGALIVWVLSTFSKERLKKIFNFNPDLFKILALTSFILFMFVQLVRIQPWDYDNNKILVYFQLAVSPLIIGLLWQVYIKYKKIGALLMVVVLSLILYSGIIDVLPRYLVQNKNLPIVFDSDAQKMAEFIRQLPDEKTILTGGTHLNLVSSLTGRPVVMGYPGWLWTRGIDYSLREQEIKSFYRDPEIDSPIIAKYNIGYVLVDPSVKGDYGVNENLFNQRFRKIFESGENVLYSIEP